MIKNRILVGLTVPLISVIALSSQAVCIKSKDDFEKAKAQLPPAFQNMPVTFVFSEGSTMGAIMVRFNDKNQLFLEGSGCKKMFVVMCKDDDNSPVKQLCYETNGQYSMTLATGGQYAGKVNGSSVTVKNGSDTYNFKQAKPSEYAAMMQKMGKSAPSSTSDTPTQSRGGSR
jgi:hypothetical protein